MVIHLDWQQLKPCWNMLTAGDRCLRLERALCTQENPRREAWLVKATLHYPAQSSSEGRQRTAGLAYQYRTPIDCTPIDSGVIANSAARLLSDVPDNTTRPEHSSFTDLIPKTVQRRPVRLTAIAKRNARVSRVVSHTRGGGECDTSSEAHVGCLTTCKQPTQHMCRI